MPSQLGTINGRVHSHATTGDVRFDYDGTTLGLTLAALRAGVKVGERITTDIGTFALAACGGGDRTPHGEWARREFGR